MKITVLGTGMAGLGAAHRASGEGLDVELYDKNSHPGGHTASWMSAQGFVFDEGPHISFTGDERVQKILADNVDHKFEEFSAYVNNYWQGHWIKHPAQCNLHGLPVDLVVKILDEFIQAQYTEPGEIKHYADWLRASYGKTFAETFPMEYGLRYHTTAADNMSTDWLGPRLYRPNMEEILRGALSPETEDVHYVGNFRYPSYGGFAAYLDKFYEGNALNLNHSLQSLDPARKLLKFDNGITRSYEAVISSLPLPELIPRIVNAPEPVRQAAQTLACTTCVVVNIGLDREDISRAHWSYFYDRDMFFTRLSFPSMFAPGNAPKSCGSIQAECYYSSKYRPLDREPAACIEPVIRDLRRCGLLQDADNIVFREARKIDYANIIFDLERAEALGIVNDFLSETNIYSVGRYGQWGYHWTDESFKSGEEAVTALLDAGR